MEIFSSHIPYGRTRLPFLVVVLTLPAERGRQSTNSAFVVLENTAKLKPVSKQTFFQLRERESSITSYSVVLTFKSAKIQWVVKRNIKFSEALDLYFSWMMTASIKLLTRTMDGCLILDKLVRRRMKLFREWWQHCKFSCLNVSIFIGFFLSHPDFALLAPVLLGPGEATHSELLRTKKG